MTKFLKLAAIALLAQVLASCSDEPEIIEPEGEKIEGATASDGGGFTGFYLLNEGNMGSNKCTLDYFSYINGTYTRNIYAAANPDQILELGDTGNDMAIYDGKIFIVVNGSNKIEILDASNAKHIAKVDIASPRHIAFFGYFAYVTSFVGDGDNGSVVAFDIRSFNKVGSVGVGQMPEGIACFGDKLYVANSGDYQNLSFKNYISVIDVKSLTEVAKIDAPINLQHIGIDYSGNLWASSRGNYVDKPSCLAQFLSGDNGYALAATVNQPVSNMAISAHDLYFLGCTYDANWNASFSYNTLALAGRSFTEKGSFITDGTEKEIVTPYAIAVNPYSDEIYVTDVKNYVSSGQVFCYSKEGHLQWKATTGDIPGHICFYKK